MQHSIDFTTEQRFRYTTIIDAKIWISKNASLCHVFANQVTIYIKVNYSSSYNFWGLWHIVIVNETEAFRQCHCKRHYAKHNPKARESGGIPLKETLKLYALRFNVWQFWSHKPTNWQVVQHLKYHYFFAFSVCTSHTEDS